MGSEKTRDMAFLTTRRLAEEASTPAYHALTIVRRRPKERMAIVSRGWSDRYGACAGRRF